MAQPFLKFRQRPKKVGARKRQRVKVHKRRLLAAGVPSAKIEKMNEGEIRAALRLAAKRKRIRPKRKKK